MTIKLSGSCQLLEALIGSGSVGMHGTRIKRVGRCLVRPAHDIRGDLGPWCLMCVGVGTIQRDGSQKTCCGETG